MTDAIAGEFFNVQPMTQGRTFRILIDVPMEAASLSQIGELFGNPSSGNWIALAPMDKNAAQEYLAQINKKSPPTSLGEDQPKEAASPASDTADSSLADAEARPEASAPLAQEAGRMCGDAQFQDWLIGAYPEYWLEIERLLREKAGSTEGLRTEIAADCVREICNIKSRKELDTNPEAADRWKALKDQFYIDTRYPQAGVG